MLEFLLVWAASWLIMLVFAHYAGLIKKIRRSWSTSMWHKERVQLALDVLICVVLGPLGLLVLLFAWAEKHC